MEEFIEKLMNVSEPKTLFLLCGIFIFTDVITGYLNAIKHIKINLKRDFLWELPIP